MNHLLLLLVCLTLSGGVVDDQPYCAVRYRRLCQGKGRHIGCQFPEIGPGMSCRNYSPIQFHNELKHFITHYLNRRRQRIASGSERVRGGLHLPKPQIMMMVEWDRELALLAQRLADQCSFVHDDCRATVRYPYAGQTVGEVRWRRSSDSDALTAQRAIRRVLDAWWGERRRVQPQQLTQPFRLTAKGAVWGHFSQLAVWSLRAVGCGAVRHGTSYPRLLLVCDYSHTNMLGQRTISPGPLVPGPIHSQHTYMRSSMVQSLARSACVAKLSNLHRGQTSDGGAVWGHFSQLAVWSLRAVGCGAVRHGTSYPRLLLVCDFSHTNMLGQRTISPGPLVPCPIHTSRRPRSAYPLLCAPVRHRIRVEPEYDFDAEDEGDAEDEDTEKLLRNLTTVRTDITTTKARETENWRSKLRASTKLSRTDHKHEEEPGKPAIIYRTPKIRKTTKGIFIDKLDHELEERLKAQHKYIQFSSWHSRPSTKETRHDAQMEEYQSLPNRQRMESTLRRTMKIHDEDPDDDLDVAADKTFSLEPALVVRHKWQQTRDRPQRPGANALLNIPVTSYTRRSSLSALMLDKEDVDQLFKDTGYNPSWMRQRL